MTSPSIEVERSQYLELHYQSLEKLRRPSSAVCRTKLRWGTLNYLRLKCNVTGSKGDAVVRALASHQCGTGSNPSVDAICGLSLLLVLFLAPRGFSPGTPVFPSPQKPTLQNSNSIWNARARFNKFISTPKYFVGKQITIHNFYNWRRQTKKKQTNKQATKRNQALRKTSSLYKPRGELRILKEWGCSSEILN